MKIINCIAMTYLKQYSNYLSSSVTVFRLQKVLEVFIKLYYLKVVWSHKFQLGLEISGKTLETTHVLLWYRRVKKSNKCQFAKS